jgi:hypothetical protein
METASWNSGNTAMEQTPTSPPGSRGALGSICGEYMFEGEVPMTRVEVTQLGCRSTKPVLSRTAQRQVFTVRVFASGMIGLDFHRSFEIAADLSPARPEDECTEC